MATDISGETRRAFSIVTLDGYVSQGKALHSSVPQDHAMLQDFATYLELRLKCVNMSMLRRIFADFLNGQENTLVPMMQSGSTIITMYPVLRTSAQRRHQAEALLSKPKHHLDPRGCVFLYLQCRTATRNMAVLKQIFVDFVCHREGRLLAFVERGSQVMSVIPFELPQMTRPMSLEMKKSIREVKDVAEQQRGIQKALPKRMSKKRRRALVSNTNIGSPLKTQKPLIIGQVPLAKLELLAAHDELSVTTKRKRASAHVVSSEKSLLINGEKMSPTSDPSTNKILTRVNTAKENINLPQSEAASAATDLGAFAELKSPPPAAKSPLKRGRKSKVSKVQLHNAAAVAAMGLVEADVANSVAQSPSTLLLKDAALVAAMGRFEVDETSSAANSPYKRGEQLKASKMPLQNAAAESIDSDMADLIARSNIKRGRKLKVSLHRAPPQSATELVGSDEVELAAKRCLKRGRPRKTRKVHLQDTTPVPSMEFIKSDVAEALARSTLKRERKERLSIILQQNAAPAITSEVVKLAMAEPAVTLPLKGSNVQLQEAAFEAAIELDKSAVAESAAKVPLKRGQPRKASKVPLQDLTSLIATKLVESGVADAAIDDPAAETTMQHGRESKPGSTLRQSASPVAAPEEIYPDVAIPTAKSPLNRGRPPTARKLPLKEVPPATATELVESDAMESKSTLQRGRKPKTSHASMQRAQLLAATEMDDLDVAVKSFLKCSRPPKATNVPLQDAAPAIATKLLELSEAKSVSESIAKRGRKVNASEVQRQVAASEVDGIQLVVNSTFERGKMSTTSSVSLQEEAFVDATGQVEAYAMAESVAKSPLRQGQELMASSVPLRYASIVAAMEVAEADKAEPTCKLPSNCGKKFKTSNGPVIVAKLAASDVPHAGSGQLRNTSVAAMTSFNSAKAEFISESNSNGDKSSKLSITLQQDAEFTAITETVDFLVTEVAQSAGFLSLRKSVTALNLNEAVETFTHPLAVQSTPMKALKPTRNFASAQSKATEGAMKSLDLIPTNLEKPMKVATSPIHSLAYEAKMKMKDSIVNRLSLSAGKPISNPVDNLKTGAIRDVVIVVAAIVVKSVLAEVVSRISGKYEKPKRGQKRKSETVSLKTGEKAKFQTHIRGNIAAVDTLYKPYSEKKLTKRGKPLMSEELCQSQMKLARKIEMFAKQGPWKAVFRNVSAPFDEKKHPALARQLRTFWMKHSHAVWERKFWAPVSRRLNLVDFNKRNNRQLAAKNAFEALISSAFKELGAAFFVMLDSQEPRHPGWWYRGPVVALFAFQLNLGEDAMWDYVLNEAYKRFPDCKQPLPLSASNSGAMRIRHKRESASMWMTNHHETENFLHAIAILKSETDEGQMCLMNLNVT